MLKCSKSWTCVSQKTCTAYTHQHDPTRVMVTDSQAPVGLILFWVSGRWTLLARSQGSLQDSSRFSRAPNIQTWSHSVDSSLVQGHRSNFHHIYLKTGFWPGFWPCKGIQQVEQLNLNDDDEHGHRKEFWCFPPWKRFEHEIAPRLTAWRA